MIDDAINEGEYCPDGSDRCYAFFMTSCMLKEEIAQSDFTEEKCFFHRKNIIMGEGNMHMVAPMCRL